MKTFLFALVILPFGLFAQTVDPLAITLPNGKVIHFPTAEQKAKYVAAQERLRTAATSATGANASEQAKSDWNKMLADREAQAALDEKSQMLWIKVIQITSEGILANYQLAHRDGGPGHYEGPGRDDYKYGPIFVVCKPSDSWTDGVELRGNLYSDGVYSYTTVTGAGARITKYQINGKFVPFAGD